MKTVFADSHYWISVVNPNDPWKQSARAAKLALGEVFIVTTDGVLVYWLNSWQPLEKVSICVGKQQKWSMLFWKIQM